MSVENPAAWGYHPLEGRTAFEPNHDSPIPPFQLLLVGSQYLGVPNELANVVVVHRDLPYKEFYDLIANSDIVLPAFADNSCQYYFLTFCGKWQCSDGWPTIRQIMRFAQAPRLHSRQS